MVDAAEDVMTQAIAAFVPLLETRLRFGIFTTEDSVRYTFFAALLRSGVEPEQVVLEAHYQAIARAELDLLICSPLKVPLAAAEFKYDRAIPGGKHLPRTQKAGKLFANLRRLLLWHEPVTFYFIYLTDGEMHRYLCNPHNGVSAIFTLEQGKEYPLATDSFTSRAAAFHKAMGNWTDSATLRIRVNMDVLPDHHLWILSIHHTAPATGTQQLATDDRRLATDD